MSAVIDSKRKFSMRRNYHIKNNDIFNIQLEYNTINNDIKRSKKSVENVKRSSFIGTSLNIEKSNIPSHINSNNNDGKQRKYCELKNKENHLKVLNSPVSFNDFKKKMKELKNSVMINKDKIKVIEVKRLINNDQNVNLDQEENSNRTANNYHNEYEGLIHNKSALVEIKADSFLYNSNSQIEINSKDENNFSNYNTLTDPITKNLRRDMNLIEESLKYNIEHRPSTEGIYKEKQSPSRNKESLYENTFLDSFERNSKIQSIMLMEKLKRQEFKYNNYKIKIEEDMEKRSRSIDKLIENQCRRDSEKYKVQESESIKAKTEAKKLHAKILQLQMLDKHKRRLKDLNY